tara:strand:- start:433 stop:2469 length:2037 start_codon:yes stop_codon:yes gene_type:complete
MALDFPASPSNGDTHQSTNGIQYVFDSTKSQWRSQGEFSTGAIEAKKIDNISGSFNGNTVTFTLNSDGAVVKPQNSQSLLITLNGLVQEPGTAYTTSITTGQITFTSAPTSGTTFIGVVYSRLPISSSTTLSTTGGSMTGDIVFNSSQTFAIGGIQDGNTSQKGVVQLSTSTTNTSETLAATASAVKSVKDAIPSNLGDLSNVSSSSPSTNHVLKWSGSEWAPSAESGGASTLAALTDVSSATPSSGQVLKYNTASSQWEPGTDNTGGGSGGTTNLGAVASGAALTITSSSGDDASIPSATTSSWGVMTDEDKTKLDGIATGATANAGTVTAVTGTSPIASSGGATPAISITAASGSAAGSMSSAHYTKLEGIAASANNYAISADLLDEDDLATNSATKVASQQSIKAYVDTADALKANLAGPALTGTTTAVNLTLSGNLTVNGTTTTVSSTNTTITDNLLELNSGASSNANDSGIIIERGSTGDNAIIAWDESADKFTVGTTTGTADSTGDISITTGTLVANIEGNVTGNTSGSSGSCTGNAATATVASGLTGSPNVTVGTIGCGAITGTSTVSDSIGNLRTIVQNTQGSAYTLVAADAGKHILASGNITVPDSVFTAGQAITLINNSGSDITITKGTTMYNTADAENANRTLAGRGMATLLFTAADTCYISGAGLS